MAAGTRVLTAHVSEGLADKVDALAARIERSRGWIMKQALAAWIDQEEERHKMTLEALADVDTSYGRPSWKGLTRVLLLQCRDGERDWRQLLSPLHRDEPASMDF